MAKKLSSGYTVEEIEDMAETAGIDPQRLNHALTYMEMKRKWLKLERAKAKPAKGKSSPELTRALSVLLSDNATKGLAIEEAK